MKRNESGSSLDTRSFKVSSIKLLREESEREEREREQKIERGRRRREEEGEKKKKREKGKVFPLHHMHH